MESEKSNAWPTGAPIRSFRSDSSLNPRCVPITRSCVTRIRLPTANTLIFKSDREGTENMISEGKNGEGRESKKEVTRTYTEEELRKLARVTVGGSGRQRRLGIEQIYAFKGDTT